MMKRLVTKEEIDHLPSEIHQMVAQVLITRGEWVLKDTQTSGDCRMVKG
jgi:hypothetical protein